MFESVCIRRQFPLDASNPLDLGFLAETMLFYQDVHLVVDQDMLKQLVIGCSPRIVKELIDEEFLQVSYVDRVLGIQNMGIDALTVNHRPVTITVKDDKDGGNKFSLDKVAPQIFSNAASGPGWGRDLGRKFADMVPTIGIPDNVLLATRADFLERAYVEDAIAQLLDVIAPTYRLPQDYHFRISPDGDRFQVETNIDLAQANAAFNRRTGTKDETLNIGSLLLYLLTARTDLFYASHYDAELATNAADVAVIDAKWRDLLRQRTSSQEEIAAFQRMTLKNGHEIRESVNYGYQTWRDVIGLLKEARKFKHWLAGKPADASLLAEFYEAATKSSWVEKHPMKEFRFLLFAVAGILSGPISGLGLSGVDTYLVDPIAHGWRPNHFVEGPLKRFAKLSPIK